MPNKEAMLGEDGEPISEKRSSNDEINDDSYEE